jgi:hypothetical protein
MTYYIQDAISQRTRESSFIAFFPTLHHLDWDLISADMQRRNCLETLGDAVMSLSILIFFQSYSQTALYKSTLSVVFFLLSRQPHQGYPPRQYDHRWSLIKHFSTF